MCAREANSVAFWDVLECFRNVLERFSAFWIVLDTFFNEKLFALRVIPPAHPGAALALLDGWCRWVGTSPGRSLHVSGMCLEPWNPH